ncbi:hypothetical protein CSC2_10800 [Clostridium zeae]|uniref:WCX domain-containing protein n=1 Tax=Clostridium zeae TaxID=2759022 RepID=A0ABQ1E795_9CLOT|nr:WYL domain-containing protein [Clostridium zeae]GFZ30554.1 hypothetical protein CSC2_10800 [Clostridium zeae]
MELFHESKNRYFSLVLKILNLCNDGLCEEDIKIIIDEGEYEEKVIGKDFKTFQGLMLNKYDEEDNLNLIRNEEGKFYPLLSVDTKAPVPIRFTTVEKQWIKELLKDSILKRLIGEDIVLKLEQALKDVKGNNISSIIEKTNTVSNLKVVQEDAYYKNFYKILQAIKEEREIIYDNVDKFSRQYKAVRGLPLKIEYSTKDEVLRVSMYYIEENRSIMVNLHTMFNIELKEDTLCKLSKKEIYAVIKDTKYCKEPIVLELIDEKFAMERCFMSFSSYERYTRIIGEGKYEVKLYYYTFEETEVIRRILSLGPHVKVVEPIRIREKIIDLVKRALEID